ncbi:hypothetical protein AAG906_023607 [Vitis piasezkii]
MAKGGLIWATAEDLARNRGKMSSLYNIANLIDTAHYSLSLLRNGQIPKYIQ